MKKLLTTLSIIAVIVGCSSKAVAPMKKTNIDKLIEQGRESIILKAKKIVANKVDVNRFLKTTVRVSKKNIYVDFYNPITYLPLNQTNTTAIFVDVLNGTVELDTLSNKNGKKQGFWSLNDKDAIYKRTVDPLEIKKIMNFISSSYEKHIKGLKNTSAIAKFEQSDKHFERTTTVLEKEHAYAVETVAKDSYDIFYLVGKKDGLIDTVYVGQIIPMEDKSNIEKFNIME